MPLMQGFPPSSGEQVTLANWRTPPFNRWAFSHVSELVPSAPIRNDPARILPLDAEIYDLSDIAVAGETGPTSLEAHLEATFTDSLVVLKDGRVAFEYYAPGNDAATRHILMSVSKSVLGMVMCIVAEKGGIDLLKSVTGILPELQGTAYEGACVRDLLDMRAGILFDEDYHARDGAIIAYRKSHLWNPPDPGDKPGDLRSFLTTLHGRDGRHGDRFHYVSPNTDLLGWVLERATGRRFADLTSELLWQPMGAEHDGYITVDRLGAPRCAGGMCVTARDLARFGRLMATEGASGGRQVVPAAWVADILSGGDPDAWRRGDFFDFFDDAKMHYRSKWYVSHEPRPMVFGVGVFGQHVFVDPKADLVIARFSSQPLPLDQGFMRSVLAGVKALRERFSPF